MGKKLKVWLVIVLAVVLAAVLLVYLRGHNVAVLDPAGVVASKQRNLIIFTVVLSLMIVLPVFGLAIFIAWKYRESNKSIKKSYRPEWDHSKLFESLWWGIPTLIIIVLSIVTWVTSHSLDPYKPLSSSQTPLNIQVVALDWKWLFIYPSQNVASVNQLELPINMPVKFTITSDTVMNSFFVPNLGSQIYAMPGMATQLNLEATKYGTFPGMSANISGSGFADMAFNAVVVSGSNFNQWVSSARDTGISLNQTSYNQLAKPGVSSSPSYYSSVSNSLFNDIISRYMVQGTEIN